MFEDVFENLHLAVIVSQKADDWPIIYMNRVAKMMLNPSHSVDSLIYDEPNKISIKDTIRLKSNSEYTNIKQTISEQGYIENYATEILAHDESPMPVTIFGNSIQKNGEDYFVIYIYQETGASSLDKQIRNILNTIFLNDDLNFSINSIISLAGKTTNVSRAYIFEEISPIMTRNTYEWCADGVEPAIDMLQNLPKADYNYELIINSGMYISNDVSKLPASDREILEMQNIKALAIMTMYNNGKPIGYVGFDDCETTRTWGQNDIQYLRSIASLLSILIKRRNIEGDLKSTLSVLQLVSDSAEEIIYANTLDDYTLIFANKAAADALGRDINDIIGKKCYHILHLNQDEPCSFCPIKKIPWDGKQDRSETITNEHYNEIAGKTYITKDSIIKWVDGRYVHIESAIDISTRVEYEERLKYYASTDTLTGIGNREWGAKKLDAVVANNLGGSLCFIDIDGLKYTNDNFGHTTGDKQIRATVDIIKRYLPQESWFCRWGGDEFILWVNSSVNGARDLITKIQNKMDDQNKKDNEPYKFSFSYGIVPIGLPGSETVNELLVTADKLMYENKTTKRGLRRRKSDTPG